MDSLFERVSQLRSILLLALLFVWFNLMLTQFLSKEYALDLKFAYSAEEAYISIGHLSLEQRELYRFGLWALDMPYMIVYTLLLVGVLYRLWGKSKFTLLPALIFLADFFENLAILRILKVYPKQNEVLAIIASLFSSVKWIFVVGSFLCLLVGLGRLVYQRFTLPVKSKEAKI